MHRRARVGVARSFACVSGLRNETVNPAMLTDLFTIEDAPPDPRPYAGGRRARLRLSEATGRTSMAWNRSHYDIHHPGARRGRQKY